MSQSTPPKSKMTPRRLVLALGLSRRGRIGRLHRRPDVSAERDPSAILHAALVEDLGLLVGAGIAVSGEVGRGVVRVGLVPLLLGRCFGAGGCENEESDGEKRNQSLHGGHGTMPPQCSTPPSPAACQNPRGSPLPTCSGRPGGSRAPPSRRPSATPCGSPSRIRRRRASTLAPTASRRAGISCGASWSGWRAWTSPRWCASVSAPTATRPTCLR